MFQAVNPQRKSDTPWGAIVCTFMISVMSEIEMICKSLFSLCVTLSAL